MEHLDHAWRQAEAECPECCREELSKRPSSITESWRCRPQAVAQLLGRSESPALDQLLMAASAQNELLPRHTQSSTLTQWIGEARLTPHQARLLPVPSAIAVGISAAAEKRRGLASRPSGVNESLDGIAAHVDRGLAELWCDIALLADEYGRPERSALCRRIERRAADRPRMWARSLEWLLLAGPRIDGLDIAVTLALAGEHPTVRQAVARCARSEILVVQLRGQHVQAATAGDGPLEERLLDALAGILDTHRDVFPRPLAAPSSTWLADADLEGLLHGGVSRATADFADYIRDSGAAEEEALTATLLQHLVQHLASLAPSARAAGGRSPQVRLGKRQVPKSEEHTIGADIGLVVDVRVPHRLSIKIGDLIQVKKSNRLLAGRTPRYDAWPVNRAQLEDLLDHSPTAVYWLITGDGEVLVVPAKFLAAVGRATARTNSAQFTARYAAIRSVAVPLKQYLTDFILGLWLGGPGERTVQAADGSRGATRPRYVLRIDVRHAQQSADQRDMPLL